MFLIWFLHSLNHRWKGQRCVHSPTHVPLLVKFQFSGILYLLVGPVTWLDKAYDAKHVIMVMGLCTQPVSQPPCAFSTSSIAVSSRGMHVTSSLDTATFQCHCRDTCGSTGGVYTVPSTDLRLLAVHPLCLRDYSLSIPKTMVTQWNIQVPSICGQACPYELFTSVDRSLDGLGWRLLCKFYSTWLLNFPTNKKP